jgi:hypothetical protein
MSDDTDTIAKRTLVDLGNAGAVELVLHTPQQEPTGNRDWYCLVEVRGGSAPMSHPCWGIDALQSLISGIVYLRTFLKETGLSNLVWLGGQPGNIGLPLVIQESEDFLGLIEDIVNLEQRRLGVLRTRSRRVSDSQENDGDDPPDQD